MIHRCSILVSIGCLHKDSGIEALLQVQSFTCERFSLILSGPMNITWIKPKHMVSCKNASIILPFFDIGFFLFRAVQTLFVLEVMVSDYRNPGAILVRN